MGLYETRLFMRIVERCQDLLPTDKFEPVAYEVPGGWSYRFAFTLSSLTTSHNYRYVKKACETLKDITVSTYDPGAGQWKMAGLITQARCDEQTGVLQVEVADWVCRAIIDFRRGWRTYEIQNAMRIRNPYALRLYLITCTQKDPLTLSMGYLRDLLLGRGSKLYPNGSDFLRHCVDPAIKQLEKLNLNGFKYEVIKANGTQKGRITKVRIKPEKREGRDTRNISDIKKEMAAAVPERMTQYLLLQCGFSTRELAGKNLATLAAFAAQPEWQYKFIDIVTRWRKHRYGHGWLINAFKRETKK